MKLVALIAFSVYFIGYTQHSVEVNFNKVYIGRNFSISYHKEFKQFTFNGGVSFHVNRLPVPLSSLLKNGAHTQHFSEHFGFQIGFDYQLYQNDYLKTGLYYSNQIANIGHIVRYYPAIGALVPEPMSEEDIVYTYKETAFGSVLSSDNVIGLYLEAKLTSKIYLTTRFGAGVVFWKNFDNDVIHFAGKKPNQGNVISSQFSLGLGYTFNKK